MTDGQHHGPAVVRPREHVEAVRRDAQRAAEQIAAGTGKRPGRLITDAISWALGERDWAPFSGVPGGASAAEMEAEIAACRGYLRSAPWSEDADTAISAATQVLKVLEWLTGADDKPPTYLPGTQPGDLVGGRGLIVRPATEIQHMITAARGKIAAGQAGDEPGGDWHQGVIAALTWVEGDRVTPPMAHGGGPGCTHPGSAGLPGPVELWRERTAADRHIEPLGFKHGNIGFHYAAAVAFTLRWLYGETITPPVTGDA